MRRSVTILDAIADPHLFAPWFTDRETWRHGSVSSARCSGYR